VFGGGGDGKRGFVRPPRGCRLAEAALIVFLERKQKRGMVLEIFGFFFFFYLFDN
jgi:hypothetical protein